MTQDTKAALDAPEVVLKRCAEIFAQHNLVNEAYEIDKYIEALTTPPAQTVMGDDVREAVEYADKERREWKEKADNETHAMLREHGYRPIEKHYETLIRAATQLPQATGEQRLAALVWVEERLKVLREWQHHRENEEDGQLTYVDKSREIKIYETLKSTLQSPAVPREAVSAIGRIIQQAVGDDEIIKQSAYEVCIEGADLEALAMLGGKEG